MLVSLHNGLRKYKEGLTKDDPITSITGSTFFLSLFTLQYLKKLPELMGVSRPHPMFPLIIGRCRELTLCSKNVYAALKVDILRQKFQDCNDDVVNWHPYEVLILPEGVAQPRDKALAIRPMFWINHCLYNQPHLASKQLNLDDDTIKLMGDWFRTRVPAACVTQRGLLGKGPKDFNILWECLIAARNHLEQSWLAREERDLVTEANEASDETEPHQG